MTGKEYAGKCFVIIFETPLTWRMKDFATQRMTFGNGKMFVYKDPESGKKTESIDPLLQEVCEDRRR